MELQLAGQVIFAKLWNGIELIQCTFSLPTISRYTSERKSILISLKFGQLRISKYFGANELCFFLLVGRQTKTNLTFVMFSPMTKGIFQPGDPAVIVLVISPVSNFTNFLLSTRGILLYRKTL